MPPPRPASSDMIMIYYVMYENGKVTITVCPFCPAINQPKRLGDLDFDLEGVRFTCDLGYLCANFSLP